MAVSKTQSERPAIIALIDAVNGTEPIVAQNVHNIAALTDEFADEVGNREEADRLLGESVQAEADARAQSVQDEATARTQAVQGVQNQIGDGVFSSSFTITQGFQQADVTLQNMNGAIDDINQWKNRFRVGLTTSVTVEAGSSTSGTLVFETPFDDAAEVAVFPVCVDSGATLTDLSCKPNIVTYSGFSFTVYNNTQTNVTTKVGFLAVKVN